MVELTVIIYHIEREHLPIGMCQNYKGFEGQYDVTNLSIVSLI